MFKKLAIETTLAIEPGGPMFPPQPRPEPQGGEPAQSPQQPLQPGAAPPSDPSAPPPPNGLPAISDLNPQSTISYRKLKIRSSA